MIKKSLSKTHYAEPPSRVAIFTGVAVDSISGIHHDYTAAGDQYVVVIAPNATTARTIRKQAAELGLETTDFTLSSSRFGEAHGVTPLVYPASALKTLKQLPGAEAFDVYDIVKDRSMARLNEMLNPPKRAPKRDR